MFSEHTEYDRKIDVPVEAIQTIDPAVVVGKWAPIFQRKKAGISEVS